MDDFALYDLAFHNGHQVKGFSALDSLAGAYVQTCQALVAQRGVDGG
jgi:hypothetical protein